MTVNKCHAMGALLAASVGLVAACAPHTPIVPATSAIGSSAAKPVPVQAGGLVVPVQFPKANNRGVQYSYNNGYINSIEVTVADSLGRHQSYLVLRNPGSVGQPGQQVNVLFQNVAPGTAWVTVRTSFRQLIGAGARLTPISGSPSQFTDTGNANNTVTAVVGDITQPVLVFSSTDLGATAGNPTQLAYYQNNNAGSELNDTSTVSAGYGVGAATGSVVANNTTTVTITVGQMPAFASSLLNTTRQTDAGTQIAIPLASTASFQPGDQIVVVRAGNPQPTSDFLDITKTNQYDYYSAQLANDGTTNLQFTPTRTTVNPSTPFAASGAVNYYLARGESVSLIGGTNASVNLAQVNVHPGTINFANSSSTIGSDDGQSAMTLRANGTDTINMWLRDSFNNIVTASDFGVRLMDSWIWRPTVQPSIVQLNTGSNVVAFSPGNTVGTAVNPNNGSTTPAYNAATGQWQLAYTMGGTAATSTGASASIALLGATNVATCSYLYDPSDLAPSATYTLGMIQDPTLPNNNLALWWSLYRGNNVGQNFVASGSYTAVASPPANGKTINLTPTAPSNLPLALRLVTNPSADLGTADNGTRFTITTGARTPNDTDLVMLRIYRQAPNGTLTNQGVFQAGVYRWRQ